MKVWKTIENTGGHYEVSNEGDIRNCHTGRVLKPHKCGEYYNVELAYGINRWVLIHRVVAKAFVKNPNNYPVVNHIDENKSNNNYKNLEWCTQKYNVNYGNAGLHKSKPVIQISSDGTYIREWDSIKEASETLGIHRELIAKVCRSERFSTHGYRWKFKCVN